MKKEKLEEIKRILYVVDMVNGFIREGSMHDSYIEHIIPEQVRIIEEFLKNNDQISFIKDSHEKECSEFKKFPIHCLKGTYESELVDELKKYESNALIYHKNSTSAIHANNFLNDLDKMKKLGEVVIVGCCTDICILNLAIPLQTYFDENNRDINIIIPKNAVETYSSSLHNREKYNNYAFKMLEQSGIQLVKKYKGGKYDG